MTHPLSSLDVCNGWLPWRIWMYVTKTIINSVPKKGRRKLLVNVIKIQSENPSMCILILIFLLFLSAIHIVLICVSVYASIIYIFKKVIATHSMLSFCIKKSMVVSVGWFSRILCLRHLMSVLVSLYIFHSFWTIKLFYGKNLKR